jgi:hypothetical protein
MTTPRRRAGGAASSRFVRSSHRRAGDRGMRPREQLDAGSHAQGRMDRRLGPRKRHTVHRYLNEPAGLAHQPRVSGSRQRFGRPVRQLAPATMLPLPKVCAVWLPGVVASPPSANAILDAGGGQLSEETAPNSKSSVRMASLPDGRAEQQFTGQQWIAVPSSILLNLGFRRENAAISVLGLNTALNGGPS